MTYVAAGIYDDCWTGHSQIWDIAAGGLLITEAGGTICELNGGNNYHQNGSLIAGNNKLINKIREILDY